MMLRFFGATIAMRCTHIAWTIYFTDQNRTHTCTPYKDVGAIRASLVLINIPKQAPYQVTALGCGNAAFCKHITKRLLIHIRTGTATEFVITRNYIKWSHGARIHMRFAQSLSHTPTQCWNSKQVNMAARICNVRTAARNNWRGCHFAPIARSGRRHYVVI